MKAALPAELRGKRIHLVGAKGTGMCALAEILCALGAELSGSDVADVFYTDAILDSLPMRMSQGFSAENVERGVELVIHSAAYKRETHPELLRAAELGIPCMLYTEALGDLSLRFDSSGISGVHGKTTTTALTGAIVKECSLPAIVLAGSAVSTFGGRSTYMGGDRFFVAETCEYQRHFLSFHPRRIVLTSVESDHQDYYPTYADILAAFVEYGKSLPAGGRLIYCADDPGAVEAAQAVSGSRPDILLTPYGQEAEGPFRMKKYEVGRGEARFALAGLPGDFAIRIPGLHVALDAVAAIALSVCIMADRDGRTGELAPTEAELEGLRRAIAGFSGSKRRSEILGEAGGVLFMDDYGHHPTAIRKTLEGLRAFHPDRRIIIDFMSHTYSRTAALLTEFASSFGSADEVVLHKIYPSAREKYDGTVDGRSLFRETQARHPSVRYFEEPDDAFGALRAELKPGDLFITMGAGDNYRLGERLLADRRDAEAAR